MSIRRKVAGVGLVAVIGVGIATLATLRAPYAPSEGDAIIEFPRGTGTRQMAQMLYKAGVIRSEWMFLAARSMQPWTKLQAGEYKFSKPASVFQVMDRIARGDIYFLEVTIPEGSNIFDIARLLESQTHILAKDFLKEARNPAMIRDLAPKALSLEGFLYPATYRVTKRTSAAMLCKDMTERFRRAWKPLESKSDVLETVTLASLVEKETGVGSDRPLVASVFYNRLDRSMKLDCDPTTIYAALLQGRFRGTIYRSDLDSTHPFNTYQHLGLPPGPIANPGMKSLEAAVNPAKSEFLYFVASPDGAGKTVFSTSLEAHIKAVAEYRRGQKGKAASPAPAAARQRKAGGD